MQQITCKSLWASHKHLVKTTDRFHKNEKKIYNGNMNYS